MDNTGKKALVGMSGGVDSSAAAVLLKEQGYNVTGCTMRLFGGEENNGAAEICRKIGIEHIVLDFASEFDKCVMTPFSESYINGETPNPCILCNKHLKFGRMLKAAEDMGFDCIATGHYADISFDEASGKYRLLRPADERKDQTYVLYSLTQHQLSRTLFPLYGKTKEEVRALAEKCGLDSARKKDSQDICFVPDGDYARFIKNHSVGYTPVSGNFIDSTGNILGRHSGIINYTVGQRRGLGITFGKPVFVTEKNAADNTVTLGGAEELMKSTLLLRDISIISGEIIVTPIAVAAKARYNAAAQPAVLYPPENGMAEIRFDKPVKAPAKGQACVFYNGNELIGGGTITGS